MINRELEKLIDIAITKEEEAFRFYTSLFDNTADNTARETLTFLAEEELKHREFLVDYRNGKYAENSLSMNTPVDYRIAEYIEKPDAEKDPDSAAIYLIAAHMELDSYNFYSGLAGIQPEGEVKEMLIRMAAEELKHKEKVEYLYSNMAFPQTEGG